MRFSSFISRLFLIPLFASCALVGHKPTPPMQLSDLSPERLEALNREALALASERLEKMVIQAKSSPQSSNYLATDLFLKANMSLMEEDFATASVLFKYVVDLAPEDTFVQKKYAISLIRMDKLEEAEVVLEKLYRTAGEEKVGMILAGVYTGIDKEVEARKVYHQILSKNISNEDACIFLSKSYALDKQVDKATVQLNSCAKANPKSGIYDYYLGKLHVDQGKMEAAVASFKKSHEKQHSLTQAISALGIIYEERENFSAAHGLYENHLKKHPSDSAILSRMVQILFAKEKYEQVIPFAEKLSDLEPDNLNLKVKLGILYTDSKKYSEAISVFKELLVVAPESDKILYYLGAIHQEKKEYQQSIEYFNQIPATSGLFPESSVQMANMLSTLAQDEFYSGTGERALQESFLNHVKSRMETQKELVVEYSVIKSGFFEATNQHLKAMETMMVVQDEQSFSTQHKYYLANLYEREKKFKESTALIMGIIEKDPKNAHAWNFLGYSMLVREEEMDKAYEYIQTALKISPDDGYIRDSLGWYYFKKGDVSRALSELQFALNKVPDDVEILKHLAMVHSEMKNFEKARGYLQTALKHARYQSDKVDIMTTMERIDGARIPASKEID